MKQLILLGGGGHASDLLGVIEACNQHRDQYRVVGIFDDNANPNHFRNRSVSLFGDIASEHERIDNSVCRYIGAVGYPATRLKLVKTATKLGLQPASPVVHPGAVYMGTGATVGDGSVVHAGASISVNVTVGDHCYLSHGCLIGHDSVLQDGCAVMPGASLSGGVKLGVGVMVGSGAVILEGIEVGDGSQIGANAVVTSNVDSGVTVVGIPARPLQSKTAS